MEGQTPQDQYIDNALRAVQNKRQIPEIDFTLHTMEDGTQVSTQERVCKGTPDVGGRDSRQYMRLVQPYASARAYMCSSL